MLRFEKHLHCFLTNITYLLDWIHSMPMNHKLYRETMPAVQIHFVSWGDDLFSLVYQNSRSSLLFLSCFSNVMNAGSRHTLQCIMLDGNNYPVYQQHM